MSFYRKFLYEPFPVESCLQSQLHDHFNAEVVSGTIRSLQDGVDFLTWTYFYRRLTRNPGYYHLEDNSDESVARFLSDLVEATLADLQNAVCALNRTIPPTRTHMHTKKRGGRAARRFYQRARASHRGRGRSVQAVFVRPAASLVQSTATPQTA